MCCGKYGKYLNDFNETIKANTTVALILQLVNKPQNKLDLNKSKLKYFLESAYHKPKNCEIYTQNMQNIYLNHFNETRKKPILL